MSEFNHFINHEGFTYEITGKIDVEKGIDSMEIDNVMEFNDPYGIGLGIKRLEVSDELKAKITDMFIAETKALFEERAKLMG